MVAMLLMFSFNVHHFTKRSKHTDTPIFIYIRRKMCVPSYLATYALDAFQSFSSNCNEI